MSLRSSFFSLQLILTLLAASIVIFSSQLCVFHVFFFRNKLRLLSFFCFVFRSSSFSVIGVGVVVVGRGEGAGVGGGTAPNARSRHYQIFSRLQVTIFFFRTRESFANTYSLLRKEVTY